MPSTKLHRFLAGGWNAMTDADTRIYYEGAWHSPCGGSKTLAHFVNGEWVKFPCVNNPDILFLGYPTEFSYSQGIMGILKDGASLTSSGDHIRYLTTNTQSYADLRQFNGIILTRDYERAYTARKLNVFNRSKFIEFVGGDATSIEWDLTNGDTNVAPDAPLWLEFEFSTDGGLFSLMDDSGSPREFSTIATVTYSDGSQNRLQLYDPDLEWVPKGWYDYYTDDFHTGDIDETQWHTVRWKIPDDGQTGEIEVDGNATTLDAFPSNSGNPGLKVTSVAVGILYDNNDAGGWWYMGRVKIGTTPGLGDIVTYTPYYDGYPWQDDFTYPLIFPNMSESPDRTVSRGYAINLNFSPGSAPGDYISWSYPSFDDAFIYPPSGGEKVFEIWEVDRTGLRDNTLSDAPGFPAARVFRKSLEAVGTYPDSPNAFNNMKGQITGHGLDVIGDFYHGQDVGSPFEVGVSLKRVDLDGTEHTIRSRDDYPTIYQSDRYNAFYAQFSPSGNKIAYFYHGRLLPSIKLRATPTTYTTTDIRKTGLVAPIYAQFQIFIPSATVTAVIANYVATGVTDIPICAIVGAGGVRDAWSIHYNPFGPNLQLIKTAGGPGLAVIQPETWIGITMQSQNASWDGESTYVILRNRIRADLYGGSYDLYFDDIRVGDYGGAQEVHFYELSTSIAGAGFNSIGDGASFVDGDSSPNPHSGGNSNGLAICDRDGSNVTFPIISNPFSNQAIVFDPNDESRFFYDGGIEGAGYFDATFGTLNVGYIDGTTPSAAIHDISANPFGQREVYGIPVFSPDGSTIIFTDDNDIDGASRLMSIAPDGTGLTVLFRSYTMPDYATNFAIIRDYAWSPDGTQIAFMVDDNFIDQRLRAIVLNVSDLSWTEIIGHTDTLPAWYSSEFRWHYGHQAFIGEF